MSHRWSCPTDYEAESEGRRAGHDGFRSRYSNPYGGYGEDHCPEAEEAWSRGFRSGEYAKQHEDEEAAYERRCAERRRQQAEEEEYWQGQNYLAEEAQRQEYELAMQREYEDGLIAEYELEMAQQRFTDDGNTLPSPSKRDTVLRIMSDFHRNVIHGAI